MVTFFKKLPVTVQVAIKYGLYSALLLILVLVGLFYSDRHPLMIPVIFDVRIFLLAIFIFFALKEFRELRNHGELHFWQGMAIGMIMSLTMGILAAIFLIVFGNLEGAFLTEYIDKMVAQLTANKDKFLEAIGEEAFQNTITKLPATTIVDLAMDYLMKTLGIAFLLTIIISIILRKQPKNTELELR